MDINNRDGNNILNNLFINKFDYNTSNIRSGIVKKAGKFLNSLAEGIAEIKYEESFKDVVTLKECVDFCVRNKCQYPNICGFVISVQKNFDPRNENDALIIVQGLLDEQRNPVSVDGINAISQVIHTKTIDMDFISFLDGTNKKIYMINE